MLEKWNWDFIRLDPIVCVWGFLVPNQRCSSPCTMMNTRCTNTVEQNLQHRQNAPAVVVDPPGSFQPRRVFARSSLAYNSQQSI